MKDLKELALFLTAMNSRRESHIGYCGEDEAAIFEALQEDFVTKSGDINFYVSRGNTGEIIAAIGLDTDEPCAEVWGPFNRFSSIPLQLQLWDELIKDYSDVREFQFFINKENAIQQTFMEQIKAKAHGEHQILEIRKENFNEVLEMKSKPFSLNDFYEFQKLHNELFPGTYYDGSTLVGRINKTNVLKTLLGDSNELKGYAYFEVSSETGEASLEYIGISNTYLNQGLGTLLLKEALTEMFSHPQIETITLTVEDTNDHANTVYRKAGFEQKHKMISYFLKR